MGRSVRLLSWNVNGVRAAAKKGLLDWLARERPDVLALQEIKAQPHQLGDPLKCVDGYGVEWNSAEQKGYSGVGTYSRLEAGGVERGLGVPSYDREGRTLIHTFPEFTLFNLYVPNGQRSLERLEYKLAFCEELLRVLARYRKKGEKRLVVCGDLNIAHREIDLARPDENREASGFLPEEREWMDRFEAEGFVDSFREFEKGPGHYTWWQQQTHARDRNVGWRIDYFFVSDELRPHLKSAFILPEVHGSDHCPVGVELSF